MPTTELCESNRKDGLWRDEPAGSHGLKSGNAGMRAIAVPVLCSGSTENQKRGPPPPLPLRSAPPGLTYMQVTCKYL